MAEEQQDPEGSLDRFSPSLSKKIEEPESLPGGRSSAAERRVVWRSASEIASLLAALEASGESVHAFAASRGLHVSTLYGWLRRARHREPLRRTRSVRGRQVFSSEERRGALEAWSKSGLTAIAFSKLWGVSPESLRGWRRAYELGGPQALEPKRLGRPTGAGRSTLPAALQSEIVRTKRRFPFFGLKKVRDFLKRFAGQSVSTGSVRKVLAAEGLHARPVEHRRRKRPLVRRFERSKPGELWQTDITSFVLARSGVRVYLVVFLDDFSRYVVSWKLATSQRSELVCEALMEGIERFGKPKEVLSDQGRQYFAWRGKSDFQRLLVREGIEHVVARTHHPETLGKCERLWETIGTELWERARPQELAEARERLGHYFAHYNHFRPHQGIDGLVPADRFFGAEEALKKSLETRLEKDELGAALASAPRQGVYVFGQVGDELVSLHGERGRLVVVTSGGVTKELALDELGLPQKEATHDRDDDDGGAGERPDGAHATQQETAGIPASAAGAALGAEPVGVGERGGAGEGAHDVRGVALDVARAQVAPGGGAGALAASAAGVAAQPGGAVGYVGGPSEAAPRPGQEPSHGAERGRSACAEEAPGGAGGGEQEPAGAGGGPPKPASGACGAAGEGSEDEVADEAQDGEEDPWPAERGTARS
jgi:transposase InsO family protein/transposase-like protein